MTIRLRCAECRRKLKVPDEALGRKVQCPVCGALFRHSPEASPQPTQAEPQPTEMSPIDALFAEMAASPTAPLEQADSSPFPNLQLEAAPAAETQPETEFEPLEEEEPTVVEEAIEEEAVEEEIAELTDDIADLDAVDVVDEAEGELADLSDEEVESELANLSDEEAEVVEEAETDEKDKKKPKKKKKKSSLLVILIGAGVLLVGGVLAYFGYSYFVEEAAPKPQPKQVMPQRNPRVPPAPQPPPANPR